MSSTWTLKENSQGELKVKVEGETWKDAQEKAFKKLAKEVEIEADFISKHIKLLDIEEL